MANGQRVTRDVGYAVFRFGEFETVDEVVFAQPGALPAPALDQVIEGVRGLDMDDVRRQIAEQQPAEV